MRRWGHRTGRALRRLRSDERGASAIEFAFVAPILIVMTLGAIETARAISAQAAINHAVKETVRFASVRGMASGDPASAAELEAMALAIADLAPDQTTAAAAWVADNSPGGNVTITMQHTFLPVAMPFKQDVFTFEASASMTVVR